MPVQRQIRGFGAIIADKPGGLIESTLELNLNEPCKIQDTSWIETGRYIGLWWAIHLKQNTWSPGEKHGATTENTLRYIDFAAQHGFKGVLVEGWNQGWETDWWLSPQDNFSFTQSYPDFDLEKVCAYALSKNVRLVGHHETGGAVSNYEKQIKQAVSAVNGQVHLHGFQPASFTRTLQNKAAISVVPSLWAEPCGLTGLEALAAGSALITTNAGGIPEYASGRAVMINLSGSERDDQNAEVAFKSKLAQELHRLINDNDFREALQHNAFNDFPFTAENMVDKANKVRQDFLSRFTNTQL